MSKEGGRRTSATSADAASAGHQPKKSIGSLRGLIVRCVRIVSKADRRVFRVLLALQVISAATLAGQVLVVKSLLDGILAVSAGAPVSGTLLVPVFILALVTALASITTALQGGLGRFLGEAVARSMWQDVQSVATTVTLRQFERPEFYDRLQRVQANAAVRPYQVTRGLLGIVGAVAASIGVGASLVALDPLLLPLLLLGGVPLLITSRRESRLEFDFSVAQTAPARLRSYLSMLLMGRPEAKEIRAFDLAPSLRARFDALYARYLGELRLHLRRRAVLNMLGSTGAALVLAGTLLVLVLLISRGTLSIAAAGAAIVAIRLIQGQVQSLFGGVQTIFESALFLDDVDTFMQMGPTASREEGGRGAPPGFTHIEMRSVGFTYPGSKTPAIEDIDLEIHAGEVIALVGENGSGKTTLAKILAGLYDPGHGEVLWDDVAVTSYHRAGLRAQVAVIFQDFVRYALTARENIALGRPEAPADTNRLVRAAAAAGADSLIDSLPQGYDTVLSRLFSGGRDLSGGQWQRIALARAFYRSSPLVILDEPTASLDPRAEHELFATLREVLQGRTAVFISHRFSSVTSADRIYVLAQGRVIESGSHLELMQRGGHYADLFNIQAATYLAAGQDREG